MERIKMKKRQEPTINEAAEQFSDEYTARQDVLVERLENISEALLAEK